MHIPKGYSFAAVAAEFKKAGKLDLGLVVSHTGAAAAGVFTTNRFQAAPVLVGKQMLADRPTARVLLVNSGQANACTGEQGMVNCRRSLELAAKAAGVAPEDVLPVSTGVIGAQLKMDKWEKAMGPLAERLATSPSEGAGQGDKPEAVARAMMTTDTFPKLASSTAQVAGGQVAVMGMAKGAGMISPNMATLLVFVLTDAGVGTGEGQAWWRDCVRRAADRSFNRVTVDGDTSTNDTLLALANNASGHMVSDSADQAALERAVTDVCQELAYMIVMDAEGGTKVARIRVTGAASNEDAELAARAVGNSPLVKTALFGADANWGRVVAAVGRSGACFKPDRLVLKFGDVVAFAGGTPADADLDMLLTPLMKEPEVLIHIDLGVDLGADLGAGQGEYELLASDLTHDYVSINADYRT